MTPTQPQQPTIVTHRENRTTHYHLRRRGYGRLLARKRPSDERLVALPRRLPGGRAGFGRGHWQGAEADEPGLPRGEGLKC